MWVFVTGGAAHVFRRRFSPACRRLSTVERGVLRAREEVLERARDTDNRAEVATRGWIIVDAPKHAPRAGHCPYVRDSFLETFHARSEAGAEAEDLVFATNVHRCRSKKTGAVLAAHKRSRAPEAPEFARLGGKLIVLRFALITKTTGCAVDWLTFFSKVIDALAWPVAVGFFVLKFRDRFDDILGRLREFSLPGVTGKLDAGLKEAEAIAAETLPPEVPNRPQDKSDSERASDLLALYANPTGTIMEAWKDLEATARALLDLNRNFDNLNAHLRYSINDTFKTLTSNGLIPDAEEKLVRELREIRNRAAHSTEQRPTPQEAQRFLSLVEWLKATWIARIANGQPR
ncbi:hypothetical protein [Burkholderia cepacia]|uniref:hypothetical protein n=1 Tax=Burkholderia cepacia TaxID=292 RepID=UPI001E353BFD|nr:hypothetical protein [Burkholderia cepacia]